MLVKAARINKLFGTDGGLMIGLYAGFPEDFDPDTPLMAEIDGLDVPLYCERYERRGAAGAVVAFADIDTERRAAELVGRELRIDTAGQVEEAEEEFRMEDLIGFEATAIEPVHAEEGRKPGRRELKGVIRDYYDSDLNPLFELEIDGRSILVPATEAFVARIDFDRRRIRLVLPEGLTDLDRHD